MDNDREFIISVAIIGGIVLIGLITVIVLTLVALRTYRKKKIIRELYEKKERENGQEKAGARGKW